MAENMSDTRSVMSAHVPKGYRLATWGEYSTGTASHAVCKHGRVVAITECDHRCRWTAVMKEDDDAASGQN
jgi:hypothetical protein